MIDTITLEIIRQFPRPCLNCKCYIEEKFVIPREEENKPACQSSGSYLFESCLVRVGANIEHTFEAGDFNKTSTDFFNTTNQAEAKVGLADITCSTCYKFVLEPIMSYFANSNDKKPGAETNAMSNVKRYREGQLLYPFYFKAIGHKEPSAEASNTDRPITGISFVDEDEEAVIEV